MRGRHPARRAARCLAAGALIFAAPSAVSLAQAPAPSSPAIPSGEDIVVLGGKIRKVRLNYALWGRHMKRCDPVISSGDDNIDRFVCTVLNACIRDGFRDPVPAKACLDERIASVAYRPPPWDPAASAPEQPAGPAAVVLAAPPAPADTEIVVTGGRPHVAPGLWRIDQSATFSETPYRNFQPFPGRVYTVCIAPEHQDKALEALLGAAIGMSDEGLCTLSAIRVRKGKVTGGKTCSIGMGPLSFDLHGKVNGETMDTAVSIVGETASTKTRYRRRLRGARVGDCPS